MDQADRDDSVWSEVRSFAGRHIRPFALLLCPLSVCAAILVVAPSILVLAATPIAESVPLKATVSVTYLDKDGKVIGRQGPVPGKYVRLSQLPAYLPRAFLAMEDRRFYFHHGVDLLGLSRAAYNDIRARRFVAGGSTVSQQTAKLLFTDGSRTFHRKLYELANAARLEKTFSKDQILEIYLNRIFLGEGTFGVDSAARNYFGVPASNLTLPQAAMLAGLTRAPTLYSPRRNLELAQRRSRLALAGMVETGAVTKAQAQAAMAHPAVVIRDHRDDHDYVLDAAAAEVQKLLVGNGMISRGLVVHTTIDSSLQAQTQNIVQSTVARLGPKLGFSQAALVLMTPEGNILGLVGGADYRSSVFDRATQAHRQPGSAFKPFVYLAALEHGISPWELRQDQPVNIAGYQPANYENASYGQLRLIDALARSVNTISVNLAQEVGIANVSAAARRLGIVSPLHDNASLALGTDEVTPLELTAAYAAFANGGKRIIPHLVSSVSDGSGTTLFRRDQSVQALVLSDSVRRDMTAMLGRVVEAGTGTAARLPRLEAAGKTGTTQDYRDAWFVGFTAHHVAGVWIGNDDNHPMRKVTGGTVPAQMWKSVMLIAEAHSPAVSLDRSPVPPEINSEKVIGPAYLDNPTQEPAFVDTGSYHVPDIPPSEPAPPIRAFSSALVPAFVPSQSLSIPPPAAQQRGSGLVTQRVPTPPQASSSQLRENTKAPGQDDAQSPGIPLEGLPPAVAQSAQSGQRPVQYPPTTNTPDAQALYQERRAEYLRVMRQVTTPDAQEERPVGAQQDGDAPFMSLHQDLPYPR